MILSKIKIRDLNDIGSEPISLTPESGRENDFRKGFAFKIPVEVSGSIPLPDGSHVVAFASTCPHMGCTVNKVDTTNLVTNPCPCHGSTFDLAKNGLVILGPATQNLPQLELEIDSQDINVVGWIGAPDPNLENWPCKPAPPIPPGVA